MPRHESTLYSLLTHLEIISPPFHFLFSPPTLTPYTWKSQQWINWYLLMFKNHFSCHWTTPNGGKQLWEGCSRMQLLETAEEAERKKKNSASCSFNLVCRSFPLYPTNPQGITAGFISSRALQALSVYVICWFAPKLALCKLRGPGPQHESS